MLEIILTALALFLVIEGVLPFASPQHWRAVVLKMLEWNDSVIRIVGLCLLLTGVILMCLVHSGII